MNGNSAKVVSGLGALFIMVTMLAQYAGASGIGWVLYGNVISASTCLPISGANVSSPYDSYAHNITNANGGYQLILGTGNWSVTTSASGYVGGSYLTPYETAGALNKTFALLPVGGVAGNCLSKNTTVITNITETTVTPGVNQTQMNTTSVATTAAPTTTATSNGNSDLWIGIVIVAVIVIIAYFLMKKKPSK